jgi:outer membrane protein assembly factor BamB
MFPLSIPIFWRLEMKAYAIALASLVLLAAAARAETPRDAWPQWRGPLNTGAAPGGDPPTEWSESKNVRWKVAIPGRGHATPIVWGDRIYVLTAVKTDRTSAAPPSDGPALVAAMDDTAASIPADSAGQPAPELGLLALAWEAQDSQPRERPRRQRPEGDQPPPDGPPGGPPGRGGPGGRGPRGEKPTNVFEFRVLALERATGKTLWDKTVHAAVPHAGTHQDGSHASASPVTDGECVYASFGSNGLYCLDRDGNVKWDLDLGDLRTRNNFGEGASPALYGDTLVVNWDHEGDDFIVALNKKTGKEIWRKPRDEPTTWSTPLIVEVGGKPQVIIPATNHIRAYDLETGETVWECGGLTENVIPSGVAGDGMAYLISGYRGNALRAVRLLEARGDLSDSKSAVAWTYDKNTPYVPSPLLVGGLLYFFDNNRPILTCLNAKTGESHYGPQRMEGLRGVYASPVAAGGRVYIAGRDGETVVLKQGPTYEVLATNNLDDGFDASPAIVGKELFLRGREHLYCIAAQ